MKLSRLNPVSRRQSGILLTECLVYIAVFFILFGIASATFYFCWDHTHAVVYAANQVETAVRAGERWRADIRAATGPIYSGSLTNGETIRIPQAGGDVTYTFRDRQVCRQKTASGLNEVLVTLVKDSAMSVDSRGQVNAWRWEMELSSRRRETHLPFLFTFEAVPGKS